MDYPSLHLGLFSTLSASQRSALAAQLRQVVDAGFRWSLSEDLEARVSRILCKRGDC